MISEKAYRWDTKARAFVASQRVDRFLKGPVPMSWLTAAARLPGKTLAVAIALWRLSGAVKSPTVKLSNAELEVLCVDRNAKSRALRALQKAGLISIEQRPGCLPRVTILMN
jgi:hypothetical protein